MEATTPVYIDQDIDEPCTQKNSCLPIFRLPPETLEDIFAHCARDYYESDDYPALLVPRWVNVSYVCRHWRNVALNCPTLWSYHFTVSLRWTEELLARSKQASLKIYINCVYCRDIRWWSCLVEKVLNHVERIQELCLNVPGNVFPTVLSLNAPRLQILDVHFPHCPPERTFVINNADTLSLRTLKLVGCPLPWDSSLDLGRVTTLFLSYIPSLSQQSITEFQTTLGRMQALKVLHLEGALPSGRSFLCSGFPKKITLPCLTRFFVRAPPSTAIALMSFIDMPLTTQVRLEIELEFISSSDDFTHFPLVLAQRFSQYGDVSSPHPPIRSLAIHFYMYELAFTLSASEQGGYDPSLSMAYPPLDCGASLVILARMRPMVSSNLDGLVGDICCSIPAIHVQTLHIINTPSSPHFWKKMLGHLDGLRRIKLSTGCMPDLISLLALTADGPVGRDVTRDYTFVPSLEELDLDHIKFAFKDGLWGKVISEQSLSGALSFRKALRVRLTE